MDDIIIVISTEEYRVDRLQKIYEVARDTVWIS